MIMKNAHPEAEADLEKWDAVVKKLEDEIGEVEAADRSEYQEQLALLSTKYETVDQQLRELEQAGNEARQELKAGIKEALLILQQSLDRAKEKLQEAVTEVLDE